MIIDTHCHLDDNRYLDDLPSVIEQAQKMGVKGIMLPGADIEDLPLAQKIAHEYEHVYFAAGVHPYHREQYDEAILREFLKDEKCIAVGECGLDYFRLPKGDENKLAEKKAQQEIFIKHIELAVDVQKPLIVHVREASQDSLDILKTYACGKIPSGVMHCYNASEILLELAPYNFFYGIGGVLTFSNAKKLVEVLPKIPLENLVLETDAPYLTPHPHRGKRNEPGYTAFVADKVGEILKMSRDEVETITTTNAIRLFKGFEKVISVS